MKKFDNTKIGLTAKELSILKRLNTPKKIQDFVSAIPQNFEPDGDSCMSVRAVLRINRAHCIEGALVGALAFWVNGIPPLVMDMAANDRDDDHVIAPFQVDGYWGAVSKSNHAYLGHRDPVYRTLRELTMSYVHEYYNKKGEKTLRTYSRPLDLSSYEPETWITGEDSWEIAEDICEIKHYKLLTKKQEKNLTPAQDVQLRTGVVTIHKR